MRRAAELCACADLTNIGFSMSTLTEAVCSILNALYIRLDELPYAHDVFEEHLRTSQFIQLCG